MAEITLFTEKVRNPVDNSWIALRKVKGDDSTGNITSIQNLSANGSTGLCITAVTSPIAITTVTAGTTIKHSNSGVTANNYGTTATTALTPTFGDTFKVPGFTVNATGHITVAGSHTVKIPATTATTATNGLMPSAAVTKLNGIATGAEVNQNAYGKIKVGSTTVTASNVTDTVIFAATGSNLTVTLNSNNNIVYEAIPAAVVSTTTPTQTGVSIWIEP